MTKNDIAKLCFKLLAVYFGMQIFFHCENILVYLFYNNEMQDLQKVNFIATILPPMLFFVFGILLWFVSPYLANSIFKPQPEDTASHVPVDNFHIVAFSVAGLYLLTISLSAIVEYIVFNQNIDRTLGRHPFTDYIIIAALKIVIGVWLILGSKGIVNGIRKLRRE